jgi:hemolysin activation/secretion protein
VTAVRVSADYTRRRSVDAFALKATVSMGVEWFDATDNPDILPDSDYVKTLLQGQYSRQLPAGMQLLARLTAQLSSDSLLPIEKLAVGGAESVRGYRENQFVRDEGAVASAELRIPLWADDTGQSRFGLRLAPFVDYGYTRNKSIRGFDAEDSEQIYSVGLGLLWQFRELGSASLYYGEDLQNVDNPDDSWQESGFHVQLAFGWQL